MTAKTRTSRLLGLFDDFGAVFAVAAAARSHRKPTDADLRRIGIDPARFPEIR